MRSARTQPHASQRRRESQQQEAREQRKLTEMLEKWLDPGCTCWSATENRPRSALSGMFQRMRGVKSGVPDVFVIFCGRVIWLELKSPVGTVSRSQREMRRELLAGGAVWWLCRSARSAMVALHRSGVQFRTSGGRRWKPPALRPWEEPQEDPSRPHPAHPAVTARRRAARRRQRAAKRARLAVREAPTPAIPDADPRQERTSSDRQHPCDAGSGRIADGDQGRDAQPWALD